MSKLRLQKENIALVQAFKSNDFRRFHELLKKKSLKPAARQLQPSWDNSPPFSSSPPSSSSSSSSSSSLSVSTGSVSASFPAARHNLGSSPSSSPPPASASATFYYPNINDYDEHRQTCLHVACTNGSSANVRELVDMGADVNAVDDRMWTPLHCALANGHLGAAKMLLVEGTGAINVNHANESGSSPLHYLARYALQ
jgi:hypothetical protein